MQFAGSTLGRNKAKEIHWTGWGSPKNQMSHCMIRIWVQNCRRECLRKEGREIGRSKVCEWTQMLTQSRQKATRAREGVRQLRNISTRVR